MAIVIGIDVGISTTKIVGINDEGQVVAPKRIKATDRWLRSTALRQVSL